MSRIASRCFLHELLDRHLIVPRPGRLRFAVEREGHDPNHGTVSEILVDLLFPREFADRGRFQVEYCIKELRVSPVYEFLDGFVEWQKKNRRSCRQLLKAETLIKFRRVVILGIDDSGKCSNFCSH